jgi:choline-glycine betaine transporter
MPMVAERDRLIDRGLTVVTGVTALLLVLFAFFGVQRRWLPPELGLLIAVVCFTAGGIRLARLPYARRVDAALEGQFRTQDTARPDLAALGAFSRRPAPRVAAVVFGLVIAALLGWPAGMQRLQAMVTTGLTALAAPLLVAATSMAVLYCLVVLIGPWGAIRLGGPDATPGYTLPSYLALVFTAGIAAGIVLWGPAEALVHTQRPPPHAGVAPGTTPAAVTGVATSFIHWGITAWAAYAAISVPLAYAVFNRDAPLRLASAVVPDAPAAAPVARLVDGVGLLAIIGGIATSLALVADQFVRGAAVSFGIGGSPVDRAVVVAAILLVATVTAVTGVHRGVRRLAAVTVAVFALVWAVVLTLGPTGEMLSLAGAGTLEYLRTLPAASVRTDGAWVLAWPVYNWAWWFSWAPFAGVFTAAISRGRTLRAVVAASVLATAGVTVVWFAVMGPAAIVTLGDVPVGAAAVVGFELLGALPAGGLLSVALLALIMLFMITSADAAALVLATVDPQTDAATVPTAVVGWAVLLAVVTIAVAVTGGAATLQALTVMTGVPIAAVALVAMGSCGGVVGRAPNARWSARSSSASPASRRTTTSTGERHRRPRVGGRSAGPPRSAWGRVRGSRAGPRGRVRQHTAPGRRTPARPASCRSPAAPGWSRGCAHPPWRCTRRWPPSRSRR